MYSQINRMLYVSAIIFFSSAWVFVGCTSKEDKAKEETQETVVVTTDSPSEWTVYRENAERTIAANEERIKTLKERIAKSNTPNLDKLRAKRIDELQEQNARLRARITEYKVDETKSDWEQFKADVQKELDDIEASLKDLDNDNK